MEELQGLMLLRLTQLDLEIKTFETNYNKLSTFNNYLQKFKLKQNQNTCLQETYDETVKKIEQYILGLIESYNKLLELKSDNNDEKEPSKSELIKKLILENPGEDSVLHKQWLLDNIVRTVCDDKNEYDKFMKEYELKNKISWDEGVHN